MVSSLKDVANAAGFSVRTVKRALTGAGYVNEATRARVLEAAERLAYRPNLAARALKTGRSHEVAVVMDSTDELHMEKLAGLEGVLRTEGYSVHILFGTRAAEERAIDKVMEALAVRRPAGVVVFPGPASFTGELASRLAEAEMPCVALDVRSGDMEGIRVDRKRGVYDAVKYLAGLGRQRIAYMGGISDRSRLDGYEEAMRELGRESIVIALDGAADHREGTRETTKRFLDMAPRPDAVQVYSDVMAMTVLAVFHEKGVRVPEDVAVVGFDDRQFAPLAWPRLTTVAQPNEEVGAAAAEILVGKMRGSPAPEGGWSRTLPTRLICRDSA